MRLQVGRLNLDISRGGINASWAKRSHSLSHWSEWWGQIFGEQNAAGEIVNENTAFRIAAVSACIKVISEDVAALPKSLKRQDGDVRKVQRANRLHYLISRKPNNEMTAYNWAFAMVAGALGWAESYAPVYKTVYGDVEKLGLVAPWDMYRVCMPDGTLYYKEVKTGKLWNPDDIIVLKPFTLDGKKPVSIIRHNAETMGFAIQSQKYRGKVFKVKPPGYLASDQPITEEQVKQIGQYWSGQVGGGVPVAYGGLKYHPISFSPADLQLLEISKATKQDICSLFRLPPTFLQDYDRATFANAEQQSLVYKTYTLTPIIQNFMQELDAKCLPESNQISETPDYFDFNLNGLLAGDFKTRMEGYRTMWQMGVPLNHFLALEDQNPVEGGEFGYVPMNMIRVDKVEEFMNKLIATTSAKEKRSGDVRSIADLLKEMGLKIQTNGHEHV